MCAPFVSFGLHLFKMSCFVRNNMSFYSQVKICPKGNTIFVYERIIRMECIKNALQVFQLIITLAICS